MTSTATPTRGHQVELILAELESLPTLPAVATQLLQLTSSSESNTREIICLIESDPSLTAKILSMVGKSSTGVRAEGATVEKAVLLMGFGVVRTAVLTMKVMEVFDREVTDSSFNRPEFWKHCLGVACACSLLARELDGGIDPEEAFVCGLLHDLGKIALDACLPKSYDRVVRRTESTGGSIGEVERQVLGVDHTVAGRRLGLRWGLSPCLIESMWLHHQRPELLPESLKSANHVRLVHLADLLVREHRIGYSGNLRFAERAWAVAQRLGMAQEAFERVCRDLGGRIEERASLIGLDQLTTNALYFSAIKSANEELGRLNLALAEQNRRLQIRSRYFDALVLLDRECSQGTGLRDVCRASAMAVRHALQVPCGLVFTPPTDEFSSCVGVSTEEASHGELISLRSADWEGTGEGVFSQQGLAGRYFLPASGGVGPIVDRYRQHLGDGPHWVLGFYDRRQWVGSAVLGASEAEIAARQGEAQEIEALLSAVGLALGGALERAETDRLAEELARANQELLSAQEVLLRQRSVKMVAEMAAGAAHELNNPLAVVSGRSQLLMRQVPDEEMRSALEVIYAQAHRCSEIVGELMSFAKPQPAEPESIELAGLISRLHGQWMAKYRFESDQIEVRLADPAATVWADRSHLTEVFDELVANATSAMSPEGGKLIINCPSELTDDIRTVEFIDNGCGMDSDVLEHAFDPFFSDRPAGRGRGLGLSRAYRLVEINGGSLDLASQPGEGTWVTIRLPVGRDPEV